MNNEPNELNKPLYSDKDVDDLFAPAEEVKKLQRKTDTTFKLAIGAIILYIVAYAACIFGALYVAWHFISKYW